MKFAHISDLHLGINLKDFSLIEDQKFILKKILSVAEENKVDALLIAGDVYDKGVASLDAIRLFEDFLKKSVAKGFKVFVISGNHDTAERLVFGRDFMESSGIYFSRVYDGAIEPVVLEDGYGPVNIYLLPFLKPAMVRFYNEDKKIEGFNDAVETVINNLKVKADERNICVAHQNIVNAERCDSESIIFGGLDGVSSEIFDCFDYTALGHIHGPQTIGKKQRVRYCGTPLKYSLSEVNHKKSVTIVEMKDKGTVEISTVPLEPLRNVREIKGTFAQIIKDSDEDKNRDDYVSIVLLDEDEVINAFYTLKSVYPHLISMRYDNVRSRNTASIKELSGVKALDPLELFDMFYENRNGLPMKEDQKAYMKSLIEEIWEGEK